MAAMKMAAMMKGKGGYDPPEPDADDGGGGARDAACKQLASLLDVPADKYDRFKRLLKLATGAGEED